MGTAVGSGVGVGVGEGVSVETGDAVGVGVAVGEADGVGVVPATAGPAVRTRTAASHAAVKAVVRRTIAGTGDQSPRVMCPTVGGGDRSHHGGVRRGGIRVFCTARSDAAISRPS